MNYKLMGRFLSRIIALEAVFMLPALCICLFEQEWAAARGFGITLAICAVVGGVLALLCRRAGKVFTAREGLVCVSFSWITLSVLGCLPFLFSGAIPSFVDALFETVSGFTTTGSSILADVEILPRGILYWRSFTHWVGGMGVLVFLLAIAPSEGGKGFTMHLLRAESPGPEVGKLVPKMKQTASILYLIYIGMTLLNIFFLLLGGMEPLEAVCTAFGTVGTGGFGVRNDSMASFSPYIQNVTTVFMILCGVNFSCYYLLLARQWKSVVKDEELRLYLFILVSVTAMIALNIRSLYPTWDETIRHAAFQVGTIISTTGYCTTDFDLWPSFSKGLLMLLMITGACAGSTAGGLKIARVLMLFKSLRRNIRQVLQPKKVQMIRINGRVTDETVLDNCNAYLAAYVIIVLLCFLVVSLDGFSVTTNITAVLATFNNIGPGLELVGPTTNFSAYSDLSKLVLTAAMLAGRLEIFPILVLFSRSTWYHR